MEDGFPFALQANASVQFQLFPREVVVPLPVQQAAPQHQAVLLRGIPNDLCTKQMMSVVLEQAGFHGVILVGFRTQPGDPCGEALLTLSTQFFAEMCVRHFRGCRWDASGVEVTACFSGSSEEHTAPAESMNEHLGSAVNDLEATISDQIDLVLQVLLAPSEFDSGSSSGKKKARLGPPGLETNETAMLAVGATLPPTPSHRSHHVESVPQAEAARKLGSDVTPEADAPSVPKPALWEKRPSENVSPTDASTEAEGTSEGEDDRRSIVSAE
eukprot:TRINITY_DN18918_c1_g1_i1.p1 TRINITY_DN18918_c1_g1~~TRINITY_DN18918_c1_g1_i1.p1  ORF type:complete len:313 (-),score=101.60 TRINITY_DN18918_c1_g1_i1:182-994(-)